jgi:hypothetical protein
MQNQKPTIVFAFDVEARGKSMIHHGIVSVGVCIGTANGVVLFKCRWNVAPIPGQFYEQRCLDEFWSAHPQLKEELEKKPVDAVEFAAQFRELINIWEKDADLYLLTDNPAFDASFINYYLDSAGQASMQYAEDRKTYAHAVHDSDSFVRGALRYHWTEQWVSDDEAMRQLAIVAPGTSELVPHMPEDDAERIFRNHVRIVQKLLAE